MEKYSIKEEQVKDIWRGGNNSIQQPLESIVHGTLSFIHFHV